MIAQKIKKIGQKSHIENATKKSYSQSVPFKSYFLGPFSLPLAESQYIIGNTQTAPGSTSSILPIERINNIYAVYSRSTITTRTENNPLVAIDAINAKFGTYGQSQYAAQDSATTISPIDSINSSNDVYSLSSIFDQKSPITPAPIHPITFENDLYDLSQKEAF